jgi:hypothetical protein
MSDGIKQPDLVAVVPKGGEDKGLDDVVVIRTELLDDNLAAFLLAGGVNVKGLLRLLDEFLDFSTNTETPNSSKGGVGILDPMEILQSWYRREGIEEFIERLRHDSRRARTTANAATVRESPQALGEGKDK